MKSELNK